MTVVGAEAVHRDLSSPDYVRAKVRLYSQYALSYDDDRRLAIGETALRSRAAFLTDDLCSGDRVLDVGCGTGDHLALVAQRVGPTGRGVGLDISLDMLALARAKLAGAASVGLVRCDLAQAIPVADSSFDAVISSNLVQELPDAAFAFAEARRVLRPGGVLLAAVACVAAEAEPDASFARVATRYHWHFLTYPQVITTLQRGGFDLDRAVCAFRPSSASAAEAQGRLRFNVFAEIMAELAAMGHQPALVRQGVALIKAAK